MAVKISLVKKIYNNKEATDSLKGDFSDIIKSKPKINTKKFFDGYEKHFYKIPKEGQLSHTTLINQSKEYLDDYKDPYANVILRLNDEIERLNEVLNTKEDKFQEEHPFYPNNTLLKFENNSNPLPIWIMQNGAKREIINADVLSSIKKAIGYDHDTPTNDIAQLVDLETLEEIINIEPKISTYSNLNDFNFTTSTSDFDLSDFVNYTSSEVTCIEGKQDDLYDWFKPLNTDGWQINGLSNNEGRNRPRKDYLEPSPNNGGCIVRYYGIGLNDAGKIEQKTARIYPGESKRLYYRNNPIIDNQEITNYSLLHEVKGFVKEVRKTPGRGITLGEEEYRKDDFNRIFSNLSPHEDHLDDINGKTRVRFYDVPTQNDIY